MEVNNQEIQMQGAEIMYKYKIFEIMLWCSSSYEDNGLVPKGIMFDCFLYDGGKLQYFQEHLKFVNLE